MVPPTYSPPETLAMMVTLSRDEESGAVPTDVYSFHADSATVETDTYLCSYTEAASEGLRNEEAQRYVDQAGDSEGARSI
jgi:hypothetical protein